MKKGLIIIATLVGFTANIFGQGQVILGNNSGSLIQYTPGNPVPVGSMFFQLYAGAGENQPAGTLTAIGAVVGTSAVAAGRIADTIIDVTPVTAPGTLATFQIYIWSSNFATYNEAIINGGVTGRSVLFAAITSASGAPSPPTSLAGLYPGVTLIPEPSTFVLGILGAGSILLLRKRK